MARLGCSTRILVGVVVVFLVLFAVGLATGQLGSSLLGDTLIPPAFRVTGSPHVELASEHVTRPLFSLGPLGQFSITNTLLASWLAIATLGVVAYLATHRMKLVPGRFQSLIESAVEALLNFVEATAGSRKDGRMFFPLIATIFLMVISNAYLALLPFFGPGIWVGHDGIPLFRSAGTDINMPLAIALMSFFFVEYWGIKRLGLLHYMGQFFNFKQLGQGILDVFRGKVKSGISNVLFGAINLFVGVLEFFSHLTRMISFTFRLFGNMTAGEVLLIMMLFLVPLISVLPFYGLELLIGFIQALIFAGLTLVFAIISVAGHGEE